MSFDVYRSVTTLTTLRECLLALQPIRVEQQSLPLTVDRQQRRNGIYTMMEALVYHRSLTRYPSIQFLGECGIDDGGLSVEAMSIAIH